MTEGKHRPTRTNEEIDNEPWANRGTCRHCGRMIFQQRNPPDKFGNQTYSWRHGR